MSTVADSLRSSTTPLCKYFLKPVWLSSTSYVPTGTSRKIYSPLAPVCVSRRVPVAWLVITTLAAATAAPLESVTVPRMRPPVLCAKRVGEQRSTTETKKDACRMLFHNDMWKDRFDSIELTPEPRSSEFTPRLRG